MTPEPLPPELNELADRLAHRAGLEPPDELRARVLVAVANAQVMPRPRRFGGLTRRAWQAAAAAVVLLNLGMAVANGVRYQRLSSAESSIAVRTAGVRSVDETGRWFPGLTTDVLASVRPAPDVGPLARKLLNDGEDKQWATP